MMWMCNLMTISSCQQVAMLELLENMTNYQPDAELLVQLELFPTDDARSARLCS